MSTEKGQGGAGEGALSRADVPLCVCVCVCVSVHTLSRVQLFATLDYNVPGSPVRGISQARILEWVAIPLYRGSSQFWV